MMPTAAAAEIVHVQSQVGTDIDGDDVVDFDMVPLEYPFVFAVFTKRMRRDIGLPQLTPGLVVSALSGRATSLVRDTLVGLSLMLSAEATARRVGTTGVATTSLELGRHENVLTLQPKRGLIPLNSFYAADRADKDQKTTNHSTLATHGNQARKNFPPVLQT